MTRFLACMVLLVMLVSCHSIRSSEPSVVWKSALATIPIPQSVTRLAVLSPMPATRQEEEVYSRLASAVFQMKAARPALRIIDRVDLDLLLQTQQRELGAKVTEEEAVRAGRLMGLDSLLVFRIQRAGEPGHARMGITAKLLAVETGEIFLHHVVMTSAPWPLDKRITDITAGQAVQAALDVAVDEMIADLQQAFGGRRQ